HIAEGARIAGRAIGMGERRTAQEAAELRGVIGIPEDLDRLVQIGRQCLQWVGVADKHRDIGRCRYDRVAGSGRFLDVNARIGRSHRHVSPLMGPTLPRVGMRSATSESGADDDASDCDPALLTLRLNRVKPDVGQSQSSLLNLRVPNPFGGCFMSPRSTKWPWLEA